MLPHIIKKFGKNWHLFAVLFTFVIFLSITPFQDNAPFLPTAQKGYYWKPILVDEFDGTTLNTTIWSTCYAWYDNANKGCTNKGNDEQEWYKESQVQVRNGQLTLTAERQSSYVWEGSQTKLYSYVSGMIATRMADPQWSTRYGYYEAKIKVSEGKGIWPAFWLLPVDQSWPPEIDIMEYLGHEPHQMRMTYHWVDKNNKPAKDESIFIHSDLAKDWHVYSVEWQPGSIRWYVDHKLRKEVVSNVVPRKPMQLIINLAVGGKLPGNPDVSTPFPSTMLVDYVHVYQQTPQ